MGTAKRSEGLGVESGARKPEAGGSEAFPELEMRNLLIAKSLNREGRDFEARRLIARSGGRVEAAAVSRWLTLLFATPIIWIRHMWE